MPAKDKPWGREPWGLVGVPSARRHGKGGDPWHPRSPDPVLAILAQAGGDGQKGWKGEGGIFVFRTCHERVNRVSYLNDL